LSSFVAYNEHHVLEDDEEGVIAVKKYIYIYMFVKKKQKDSSEDSNVATK